MARQLQVANYLSFNKGLMTEANPINFPEGFAYDISNLELEVNGTAKRRKGIDLEQGYILSTDTFDYETIRSDGVSMHEWKAAGKDGSTDFIVVRITNSLYIYRAVGVVSTSLVTKIDISGTSLSPLSTSQKLNTAHGKGYFFFTNSYTSPSYIEYDDVEQTFTLTSPEIKIRDTAGVREVDGTSDIPYDTRPDVLTFDHGYNLRNQGWPTSITASATADGTGVTTTDPVEYTKSKVGFYPSNSDMVWACNISSAQEPEAVGSFSPWELNKLTFGNTPAARGKYILDAFNRNRSSVSGLEVTDQNDSVNIRPKSIVFYSGRAFYSLNDRILYSQLIKNDYNIGNCYQEADPTAEDINDLVATDGGEIPIYEASNIHRIAVLYSYVIIFAENGVWGLGGSSDGKQFSATQQAVFKISDVGSIDPDSIIESDGMVTYWSNAGIEVVTVDQVSLSPVQSSLTDNSIKTLVHDIRATNPGKIKGQFDPVDKKISWLYSSTTEDVGNIYDSVLIYDLVLQAFYKYQFSRSQLISGVVATSGTVTSSDSINIGVSTIPVYIGDIPVGMTLDTRELTEIDSKFLVFLESSPGVYKFTMAELSRSDFMDWYSIDDVGEDPGSYLITGADLSGSAINDKQALYITTFFNRTEDIMLTSEDGSEVPNNQSGCLLQARWGFNYTSSNNYWADEQKAYKYQRQILTTEGGALILAPDIISSRLKIRGIGQSLQIRFKSEEGKDMQLLGYSIPISISAFPEG